MNGLEAMRAMIKEPLREIEEVDEDRLYRWNGVRRSFETKSICESGWEAVNHCWGRLLSPIAEFKLRKKSTSLPTFLNDYLPKFGCNEETVRGLLPLLKDWINEGKEKGK